MAGLAHEICYREVHGTVDYSGRQVADAEAFRLYLSGPVRSRLEDTGQADAFQADLLALATTEMASATLNSLLSSTTSHQAWEVGEALAECLLTDNVGAQWPWNTERDKRTPKASLPGADLVGLIERDGTIYLLLGEVKTSSDTDSPPNVLFGRSGMIHQLDQLASNLNVNRSLLNWLHARCKGTEFWPMFQEAATHYLRSGGKFLVLYGLLLRDTPAEEADLASRAVALARCIDNPCSAVLQAWYLPSPIDQWPLLAAEDSS
ncbi:MAG: hypothetical protein M3H12_08585 [Chromatiales bacterium]|nr:hypothetical protein [Gammaproteobacteria bacterium]